MFNSKKVFIAACVCLFTFGMSVISLGAILPEIVQKFQVSELAAGGLATLLPLGILIGSLVCGPFADRYGYKGLLMLSCLLILIGMEGLAYGNAWFIIQISIFLIGVGGGSLNSSGSALVADISEGEKGANLSTLGVFYGLGALGMPLIISGLSTFFSSFSIIAGAGFAISLVIIGLGFINFPQPKQQGGFPIQEAWQLLKTPALLLFGMAMFFQSGLEGLVSNWTNGFMQDALNIDAQKALMGLTVHMAALTLMRLALGRLLKIYKNTTILNCCYALIIAGGLLFWLGNSFELLLIALMLFGAGFAGVFPIFLGLVGNKFAHLSATAFSVIFVIALLGNMILNYGMGLLSFHYGVKQLPLLLLFASICMGILFLGTKKYFTSADG